MLLQMAHISQIIKFLFNSICHVFSTIARSLRALHFQALASQICMMGRIVSNGVSNPVVTFTVITIGFTTSKRFNFDSLQEIQLLFTYFV